MRILYITFAFQHPTVRGPSRCYNFIKELSKRHEITLLTIIRSEVSSQAMEEMALYTKRIHVIDAVGNSKYSKQKEVFGQFEIIDKMKSFLNHYNAVRKMKKVFLQLVQKTSFDVVLFHGKSIFKVIENWKGLPIVVDFCDATSMRIKRQMEYERITKRLFLLIMYLRIRRKEKKLIKKTPYIAFISVRDRDAILGPNHRAKILPLGMDLGYWTRKTNNPKSNYLLYTGSMDYRPNEDGALYLIDKILPHLRKGILNLEVLIVGRNPSPVLIKKAQQYPEVTVTGAVEDMRPYFEQATVYVAPLRIASGMQNKLLEALAMEVPVVTTSIAAAGLRIDDDAEVPILVADEEKLYAECVIQLLKDKEERSRLATEGRRFIENNFVWSQSGRTLENMCLEAINAEKNHHDQASQKQKNEVL